MRTCLVNFPPQLQLQLWREVYQAGSHAASAESSLAADCKASDSPRAATLDEETSLEEEEAMEALLGLTAHSNSHDNQNGEDIPMSEADEEESDDSMLQ